MQAKPSACALACVGILNFSVLYRKRVDGKLEGRGSISSLGVAATTNHDKGWGAKRSWLWMVCKSESFEIFGWRLLLELLEGTTRYADLLLLRRREFIIKYVYSSYNLYALTKYCKLKLNCVISSCSKKDVISVCLPLELSPGHLQETNTKNKTTKYI